MAKAEFCVPLMSSLRAPSTAFDLARSPQNTKLYLEHWWLNLKSPVYVPKTNFGSKNLWNILGNLMEGTQL